MNEKLNENILGIDRREFIKRFSVGLPFAVTGAAVFSGCSPEIKKLSTLKGQLFPDPPPAKIALTTGTDRRRMIFDAVKPFGNKIKTDIAGKIILIKINCNRPDVQLIKTHPDAVRGILDVIAPIYKGVIYIGEATSANVPAHETFDHYGYYELEKEYNVRIVELNDEGLSDQWILNRDLFPEKIQVINPFVDPNVYLISVAPLKTHDTVIATLTLKNVIMGAPYKQSKPRMHGFGNPGSPDYSNSPKLLQFNIFKLAHFVQPDLAVLDGVVGAEGDGPNQCDPVDHRVALAGTDFVAVDRIGSELMGIPWEKMGYLHYCALAGFGQGERDKIQIIGDNPEKHIKKYKLHSRVDWELQWDVPIDWDLIHTKG